VSAFFPPNSPPKTPTEVKDGQTLRVVTGSQMLYAEPIQVEGDGVIQVDGVLIEVA
jgi:hypothetical protein